MADLPSVFLKVNDIQMDQDASVDEYTLNQLGQNDNFLKDSLDSNIASRASNDSALAARVSSARTKMNQMAPFNRLVESGTLVSGVEAIQTRYFLDVRFTKDTSANTSSVSLHIARHQSGSYSIQFETSMFLTSVPSAWDYGYWIWDAENDRIEWFVFKDGNVVIP